MVVNFYISNLSLRSADKMLFLVTKAMFETEGATTFIDICLKAPMLFYNIPLRIKKATSVSSFKA